VGLVHAKHDLVGEPVAEEVHAHGENEGDDHAVPSAEVSADQDQEPRQETEQDGSLE